MKLAKMKLAKTTLLSACAAITAFMCSSAVAGDQNYNQISFSVEVEKNVANDQINAILTKSADNASAKVLANTINTTLNKALTIAKNYPDVKVTTGNQNSYPRYDNKGKINGFTGQGSLNIESKNFEQASELIAELQSMMTLQELNFGVSKTARQAVETELKKEAIQRFQDEATLISHSFGASNYKIISVQLNSSNNYFAPRMMKSYAVAEASAASGQNFESGDSKLTYTANGAIEIQK